jgi:hypothetical protein
LRAVEAATKAGFDDVVGYNGEAMTTAFKKRLVPWAALCTSVNEMTSCKTGRRRTEGHGLLAL